MGISYSYEMSAGVKNSDVIPKTRVVTGQSWPFRGQRGEWGSDRSESRRYSANVGSMPGHRLRRWPGIDPTLAERLMFAGIYSFQCRHSGRCHVLLSLT